MRWRSDPLSALQRQLGHRFRDRSLLETALTHRSLANEQNLDDNYERLEFLGDAVIGLVAADWLYGTHPDRAEGDLSRLKGYLVSEPVLARHAQRLDLGQHLRLGVGEERSGGREKTSLLADTMEAIFGAVFLDGGLKAGRKAVLGMLKTAVDESSQTDLRDTKTQLQELAQARGWALPEYRHVLEEGPDHEKRFHVECWVDGELGGTGEGRSKKVAEQRAARAAVESMSTRSQSKTTG